MKLIYLGEELDATQEHELTNDFTHGVDTVIIGKDGRVETRNNCTEVHHLYKGIEPSIAFESDIHLTGGTRKVEEIETVVIVKAAETSENY